MFLLVYQCQHSHSCYNNSRLKLCGVKVILLVFFLVGNVCEWNFPTNRASSRIRQFFGTLIILMMNLINVHLLINRWCSSDWNKLFTANLSRAFGETDVWSNLSEKKMFCRPTWVCVTTLCNSDKKVTTGENISINSSQTWISLDACHFISTASFVFQFSLYL